MFDHYFSPITQKRIRKFRRLKRGYISFLIVFAFYVISLFSELLINNNAIVVSYQGKWFYPIFSFHQGREFNLEGRDKYKQPNWRNVQKVWAQENKDGKHHNWVLMPLYPYSPNESLLEELDVQPPTPPSRKHFFGTDDRGRDVFARLIYGFRISMSFAIVVTLICYTVGISIGSLLGYYGGVFDISMQRLVEIWSSVPFLYTMIIISSIIEPNFMLLVFILCLFGWMGMTYYIRGEYLREKAKDYVSAAISIGCSDRKIIFRHILPNALTPVISFAPFAIVGNISALVSLDFLGFGLPAPTPSWGELLGQGMGNIYSWWLVFAPLSALFATLLLVTFMGEAVREAFDPKEYSRLR